MFRRIISAPLLMLLLVSGASAQEWARKMFSETTHDFGTVARGADSEFVFELQNLYKEPIHIASVRASCGCVTPSIVKENLKTWEKGGILAHFNTRTFLGQRAATITVVIDQPFYAEVQLNIKGYIRGDVVFDPGKVEFTSVDQGAKAEQLVRVNYAGRSDWKIVDVRSANEHLEVSIDQQRREAGRVNYQLRVRLKESAPAGYFTDEMVLVTNDGRLQQIPIKVEGNVTPAISVSPASLFLGVVEPGQTVTKQLVVKGKNPFRIKSVTCKDGCFEFQPSDEAKTLHLIPVTFTAASAGKVAEEILIETDMGDGHTATCLAMVTVKDAAGAEEGGAQISDGSANPAGAIKKAVTTPDTGDADAL